MIIRPSVILPPPIAYSLPVLLFLASIGTATLLGWLLERRMKGKVKGKTNWLIVFLPAIAFTALFLVFGYTMTMLKGFLLSLLLLWASVSDIRSREVPDYIHVMILLTAFIGTEMSDIPAMLLGAVIVALPQLIIAVLRPGTYGGADIKITTACAFLLGAWKGLFAVMTGLVAAVIITLVFRHFHKRPKTDGIPLVPYLAAGAFLAFLI